jgi:hypothetical protein
MKFRIIQMITIKSIIIFIFIYIKKLYIKNKFNFRLLDDNI